MIVYGWKATNLKSTKAKTITCQNCRTKGSIILSILSNYVHIFWIPLFPIGRKGHSECQNCKNYLKVKEMPDDLKLEYQNLKSNSKIPIWQFSGLGLVAILIMWGANSRKEERIKELEYLSNPKIGDIYEFKTDKKTYSTFKILEFDSDSLYVSLNEYEIDKMSAVNQIDKEENYSDIRHAISRKEMEKMYEELEVYDINRK